jgi:integrase
VRYEVFAMPEIRPNGDGGNYRIRISLDGKQYSFSTGTKDPEAAEIAANNIKTAAWLYKTGSANLAPGVDALDWIRAGGKTPERLTNSPTLHGLIEHYRNHVPEGAKAKSTRKGEEIHIGHLEPLLGKSLRLSKLTKEAVQDFVAKRAKQKWHGKPISGATVRKELRTLSLLWNYGESLGWVTGKNPTRGVMVARPKSKERFRTPTEIRKNVKTATKEKQAEMWEACFLDKDELKEFLMHSEQFAGPRWLHPVIATCSYAGLRRSEWMRSRVEDWDFKNNNLIVRETKRRHNVQHSTRAIEMNTHFAPIIREYLRSHPGGDLMFVQSPNTEITPHQAVDGWNALVANTKWANLRGYHVLRHSFCSNLHIAGEAPQMMIDRWMGHQTEEQRARYRHLHPTERTRAIDSLGY